VIDSIFYYAGYLPPHPAEKLFPEGIIQVIIDLTDTPKRLYQQEDLTRFRSYSGSWLSGQRKNSIIIEAAMNSSMIVINFKPAGSYPFFQIPMSDFFSEVVEISDILGPSIANQMRERALSKITGAEKVLEVEEVLLEILDLSKRDLLVEDAVQVLQNTTNMVSLSDVSSQYGISQRHFIERFKKATGTSPKLYSRILRFQKVIRILQHVEEIDWADVVYICGYYDQAHFIKDFSEFSGYSPTQYYPLKGEYMNYIPIGR
jgi:AraC-like DNA-binding protein